MISGIINNIKENKNEHINAFNKFNINTTKTYSNYDNTTNIDNEIYDYYASVGQNSSDDVNIIKDYTIRLLYAVLEGFEKDSFWLDIRISMPSDKWKVPRWHIDGKFYDIKNYKFITTSKGPGTLFAQFDIDNRTMIDKIVKYCRLFQPKFNQGAIFSTGNPKLATIHSEPDINYPRIFISILPGTKEEINDLKIRWNKK